MRSLALLAFLSLAGCNPSDTPDTSATSGGAGGGGPVNLCKPPAGAGVEHLTNISADETWKAADGPHTVTLNVTIEQGATLTVEPCAMVRLKDGINLYVAGNLIAKGAETTPITFVADDPSAPWGYLDVEAPGTADLAYASFDDGGDEPGNTFGTIQVSGDGGLPAQEVLKVDHVTVNRSTQYGVSLRGGGAFTKDSHDLIVTGAALGPLRAWPRLVSNIPTGTYTGNAIDMIVLENDGTSAAGDITVEDVTLHDRGVPYNVAGESGIMTVGGNSGGIAAGVTLTIEPGVVLKFKKAGSAAEATGALSVLDVGPPVPTWAMGALVAVGTPEKPIVFTSAAEAPVAGDWQGVRFDGGFLRPENRMEFVEIRYAGGKTLSAAFHCLPPDGTQLSMNEDAALAIYSQPASAFLTNSLIADSAGLGVDLAYNGTSVDFLPTNQFVNVASCKVSTPRDLNGGCPPSVPCP